jgi:hypothetical protein
MTNRCLELSKIFAKRSSSCFQREIGNKALQTDVLPLQVLHPLALIKFKPAVLLSLDNNSAAKFRLLGTLSALPSPATSKLRSDEAAPRSVPR